MSRASSQRAAIEEKREARYLVSSARARAAAGGADLSDPSLVKNFAEIEAAGEYNALTRLWEGESEAISDEAAAESRINEGRAGETSALVGTAISFYGKYA